MSIHNLIHKIKHYQDIDKFTILYLFIIIGVGIGSFSLGRLSVNQNINNNILKIEPKGVILEQNTKEVDLNNLSGSAFQTEKRYVASKNGKLYYTIGCSGAKRIKPENEVWFSSEIDAEKSGYTKSTSCK